MFEEIEKYYKKNSINIIATNIIIKYYSICIIITSPLLYLLKINIKNIPLYFVSYIIYVSVICIIAYFLATYEYGKKYNVKFKRGISNKKNNSYPTLKDINKMKDIDIMKKYIKKKRMYNKETIENIINHYRQASFPKSNNFIAILAIIISIVLSILGYYNMTDIISIIIYSLAIIFIYALLYYIYKGIIDIGGEITGDKNINAILEEIFIEILNEYIIESKAKKKINNNL